MNEHRGNWYLLTGLVIGIALGLLYGWLISPVQYVDTEPASLAPAYKDEYRKVIALAYQANGNLGRARDRLGLVDENTSISALTTQAQRMVGENQPPEESRALVNLAAVLNNQATAPVSTEDNLTQTALPQTEEMAAENTSTPENTITPTLAPATPTMEPTPTITKTAQSAFTPRPTIAPPPTQSAPFTLKGQSEICGPDIQPGMVKILVTGADNQPLSGIRIQVIWKDSESTFYTGLSPEVSPGYADFQMVFGEEYRIQIGDISEPITLSYSKKDCGYQLEAAQQ